MHVAHAHLRSFASICAQSIPDCEQCVRRQGRCPTKQEWGKTYDTRYAVAYWPVLWKKLQLQFPTKGARQQSCDRIGRFRSRPPRRSRRSRGHHGSSPYPHLTYQTICRLHWTRRQRSFCEIAGVIQKVILAENVWFAHVDLHRALVKDTTRPHRSESLLLQLF